MSAVSIEAIERGLGVEAEQKQRPGEASQHLTADSPYDILLRKLAHIRRMVEIKEARIGRLTGDWEKSWKEDLSDYKKRASMQLVEENPWLIDVVESVGRRTKK